MPCGVQGESEEAVQTARLSQYGVVTISSMVLRQLVGKVLDVVHMTAVPGPDIVLQDMTADLSQADGFLVVPSEASRPENGDLTFPPDIWTQG